MWCAVQRQSDPPARFLACVHTPVKLDLSTCNSISYGQFCHCAPRCTRLLVAEHIFGLLARGARFLKRQHCSMSKLFARLSSSCCRRRFLALLVSHSRCCGEQVIKSSWCKHGHGSTSTLNVAVPPMTALLSLPHVFVSHMSTYEQKHCVLT